MPAEIVSLDQQRAERDAAKSSKTRPGNCCRGVREECGMRDPHECRTHGPYLPDDVA